MKQSMLKKFMTNNGRFSSDHPEYRRVYLLNVVILLYIAVFVVFLVLNAVTANMTQIILLGSGTVLSLMILIFFHKTDRLDVCSYAVVVLMFCVMSIMFFNVGHVRYIFVWISIFPPLAFFMLGRKKALIVTVVYLVVLLAFMLLRYKSWQPAAFDQQSIVNIYGAVLALILLISYFEQSRREAVDVVIKKNLELEEANRALEDSRERLRLILDSTAEAVCGIDLEGRCTFCNTSCLEVLGLGGEDELLGKDMHELIHYKNRDGSSLPRDECQIIRTCREGVASHEENEVFWRPDGTSFDVVYNSYPQYKNGTLVGAVVTFVDSTLKRMHEQQIEYFSSHDALTGFFNRNHFEYLVKKADTKSNLPISVIMGDLNGLKLMNDVFGHASGDELLVKSAEAIRKVCREEDIIARLGGDEFVILLPKTHEQAALQIISRIRDALSREQTGVFRCSMSLGCSTKTTLSENIDIILRKAENEMYKEKTLNRNKTDTDLINATIMLLYSKSPQEEQHAANVSEICRAMAEALGLPQTEVKLLRSAGFLHDIGKVAISEDILKKGREFTDEEEYEYRQHPVVGYRILNIFDSTVNMAEGVYCHHEHWDGTGYPRGLKGEEIPLTARIISVAGRYEAILNRSMMSLTHEEALERIREDAGTILDPSLVEVFIRVMTEDLSQK